jgi:uncharacterized membrane protein (UPF0182 family)
VRTLVFDTPGLGGAPSGPRTAPGRRTPRGVRPLLASVAVLGVLAVAFVVFSGFWTHLLWYRSVGYASVFSTLMWTRAVLFAVFGAAMAVAVGVNLCLAYRLRPPLSTMSAEQHGLDRYRTAIAPHRLRVLAAVCALSGAAAGASAAGRWRQWLEYAHATPFGTKDPQFHKDASFYTFDLPWYRFLLGFGFALVFASLAASLVGHYLYGGLRTRSQGGEKATGAASTHLAVLLGLFTGLKAVAYWLDRYGLAVRSGGTRAAGNWTGLRYVDANAYLPAKTILFFVALICSALFLSTAWRRTWTLPTVGFGLMVFSAILIGGLYPAVVQKFQVQPNEAAKEAPYLQRNIDATRDAYGIDGTVETPYKGSSGEPAATVRADAASTASIRVLDPSVVAPTFQQNQQSQGYYSFPSTLDVDRYPVDGKEQDMVVGARELDTKGIPDRSWINDHFKYTHGYGLVAADDDVVTEESAVPAAGGTAASGTGSGTAPGSAAGAAGKESGGRPVYTERDLPATGVLGDYRPQIYYGEQTTQWSVVDGPTKELDYADASGETTTTYRGPGVSLANPLTRAAYAVTLGEPKILYSGAIGHGSKILYNRTPAQRVKSVAPWLTVDGDPYPAVVGKHVVWIVDAYTTSDDYPYATRTTLGGSGTGHQVNYVRNSVKATVDAYDGTVKLYQWDTQDPVLKTWMSAFPHTVLPKSAIPAALTAHLRYPQDLFTTQRKVLTRYHVTTAQQFASGSEAWQVPRDGTSGKVAAPSYLSLRLPGRTAQTFSLTSTFTPSGRGSLAAFLSVDSDATSPDYGRLRVLELPAGASVDGPRQVQGSLNSTYAQVLSRMRGKDSAVEYGDLVTLPVDGGVLYVEPVYVRSATSDYPLLGKVFAAYGKHTALEDTLEQALDTVFAEASAPDGTAALSQTGATADPAVRAALERAQQAYDQAQKAMAKGDWSAYTAAQRRLGEALEEARKAAGTGSSGTPVAGTAHAAGHATVKPAREVAAS